MTEKTFGRTSLSVLFLTIGIVLLWFNGECLTYWNNATPRSINPAHLSCVTQALIFSLLHGISSLMVSVWIPIKHSFLGGSQSYVPVVDWCLLCISLSLSCLSSALLVKLYLIGPDIGDITNLQARIESTVLWIVPLGYFAIIGHVWYMADPDLRQGSAPLSSTPKQPKSNLQFIFSSPDTSN